MRRIGGWCGDVGGNVGEDVGGDVDEDVDEDVGEDLGEVFIATKKLLKLCIFLSELVILCVLCFFLLWWINK